MDFNASLLGIGQISIYYSYERDPCIIFNLDSSKINQYKPTFLRNENSFYNMILIFLDFFFWLKLFQRPNVRSIINYHEAYATWWMNWKYENKTDLLYSRLKHLLKERHDQKIPTYFYYWSPDPFLMQLHGSTKILMKPMTKECKTNVLHGNSGVDCYSSEVVT